MMDDDLTHKIIGCAYKVHNTLGCGFLERVYENALRIELALKRWATFKRPLRARTGDSYALTRSLPFAVLYRSPACH